MLAGAGSISYCTKDLATNGSIRGEELLHPGCIAEFEFSADSNFAEAYCLTDGVRQVAAGKITEETYTLTITQEFTDWTSLQLSLDELAQASSNVVLPVVKVATVPAGGGPLADADIDATSAASVKAYLSQRGSWGERLYFEVVGVAPAAVNEVQVDGVAGTLTFDASLAGAVVTYVVNKTYTSVETIGLEPTADRFGTMQFAGILYGTEFPQGALLVVPQIQRIEVPSLNISGDVTTIQTSYRATIPSGARKPFYIANLATAVV